jgi:alanine racemase
MENNYKDLADSLNYEKEIRPRARRFRANLNKIEAILNTGVKIQSLVDILKENGFDIDIKSFQKELYNARKFFKKQSENKPVTENKVINTVTADKQAILPQDKNNEVTSIEVKPVVPEKRNKKELEKFANQFSGKSKSLLSKKPKDSNNDD